MKYDRVYWWNGGTERGRWMEVAVQASEANAVAGSTRNMGYVSKLGHSSIGAPDGPPSEADFSALSNLIHHRW